MSATTAKAEGQTLRLVRPPGAGAADVTAGAVARVLELYRRLPEYAPEQAGPLRLAGLAMKTLEAGLRERDWGLAASALVILADAHTGLERTTETMADVAGMLGAVHAEYREALRVIVREQDKARRQAYRDGVNEGQRAFCEGRRPRRMKET